MNIKFVEHVDLSSKGPKSHESIARRRVEALERLIVRLHSCGRDELIDRIDLHSERRSATIFEESYCPIGLYFNLNRPHAFVEERFFVDEDASERTEWGEHAVVRIYKGLLPFKKSDCECRSE